MGSASDWAPSCSLALLRERADVLRAIRLFFAERGVMEVETPVLGQSGSTDPNLVSFQTRLHAPGEQGGGRTLYLQTSPEFAMKRLLAAGSGSIYQICKAFRNEEVGRFHNPEFTLLEWYRVGFGLDQLIAEVDALVCGLFIVKRPLLASEVVTYRAIFERHVGVDPLAASLADLNDCARRSGLIDAQSLCGEDATVWLDLLFSSLVQPRLGQGRLTFITDYPSIMPSLARPNPTDPRTVERVEVYLGGLELANGFHELDDAVEQDRRFEADLAKRRELGLPVPRKDERLIAALASGLPDCAGIALGLDRMLMLLANAHSMDDVLAFPAARA